MFWLIVRKEFLHNILSFRFIAAYILLLGLLLFAFSLMSANYERRLQEYITEEAKERTRLQAIDALDSPMQQFNDFISYYRMGIRPPQPLSVLAEGLDAALPIRFPYAETVVVSVEGRLTENYLFRLFRPPDFVYVVMVVGSLLALLFSFDAICGEKEQGTLQLMLANAVPRDTVLLGKCLGGYLSLTLPFAIATFAGCIVLYWTGFIEFTPAILVRCLLIFLLSLLYLATCFNLGLFISTLAARGATALVIGLLVWVMALLVVPNWAPTIARLIRPVPEHQQVLEEKEAIRREQWQIQRRERALRPENRQKFYRQIKERQQKVEDDYRERLSGHLRLAQGLARLSPSASFLFAATGLAGTGTDFYSAFTSARDRLRAEDTQYNRNYANPKAIARSIQAGAPWFYPEQVPRFHLPSAVLTTTLEAISLDVLLLLLANLALFMGAFLSFLRSDIT